ncbi:MAG TPA: hypothetical protein VEY07_01755 [Thermoplasmata archaeon]|nr:hypothetical protein [Thermoplasmata archaeon]
MDGRVIAVLLTQLLPAALIGVTIWRFASNPLALLALIGVMIVGALYILTYTETFGAQAG